LDAQAELRKVSPQLAWLQLQDLVARAIEEQYEQSQQLAQKMNLPGDLQDLLQFLGVEQPNEALSDFQYANPKFDLQNLPKQDPLKALQAVLKMLLESDRFQAQPNNL